MAAPSTDRLLGAGARGGSKLATGSHELSCRAVRWAQRRRGSTVTDSGHSTVTAGGRKKKVEVEVEVEGWGRGKGGGQGC